MASGPTTAINELLDAARKGDAAAVEQWWRAAHEEVRALARSSLGREGRACAFQTTELIGEVYLRLGRDGPGRFENQRHFFAAVANAIREILIDDARGRGRLKRGGGRAVDPLLNEPAVPAEDPLVVLAVDEALRKLEDVDALAAEVVTQRYLFGLTIDETAAALGVSPKTVDNKWRAARVWLHRELSRGDSTWQGRTAGE